MDSSGILKALFRRRYHNEALRSVDRGRRIDITIAQAHSGGGHMPGADPVALASFTPASDGAVGAAQTVARTVLADTEPRMGMEAGR